MSFLAPAFLVIGLAAAGAMVVLHLFTRDRPPRAPLPTARFVPARAEQAMTRAVRPSDPLLLAVRALALLLAGAAFARPVWEPERRAVARVVALDVSGSVADVQAARDSALAILAEGDGLVLFDSVARVVAGNARDTLLRMAPAALASRPPGALSPALIAAQRAAVPLRESADSIELVIVSALAREELDAATTALRARWNGRARLILLEPAREAGRIPLTVRADTRDALGAAAALVDARFTTGPARVIREPASAEDSLVARAGGVLVVWPRDVATLRWTVRAAVDTVGAVVANDVVLVAPFERRFDAPTREVGQAIVARWMDGEPAAVERPLGDGCVREVAVPLDPVGDLALQPQLRALLLELSAPCGGTRRLERVDDSARTVLAGDGALLDTRTIAAERAQVTPAVPWLLAAALLLGLAEPLLRGLKGSR